MSWKKTNDKLNRGFTLLEFLFSLGIFTILLTFSLYALGEGHRLSQVSRQRLKALSAVRSTLETVKNTSLTAVSSIDTSAFAATLPSGSITISTNPNPITGSTQIATITVRATWTGPKNISYKLDATTMKSRF